MEATLDYAASHFAQLLHTVERGEEVVLRKGTKTVARIVPVVANDHVRPQVGEITSAKVRWSESSFTALDDAEMAELGLL
jgi:antitoxin (DNA-binding transcriptional repressor) of toxin-antitoxin stability system